VNHRTLTKKRVRIQFGVMGLFCRRELQERCAAASGLLGSAGMRWSAVNGSCGFLPSPHIQQATALSLICLDRFL